jgi:hypothetical protein
MLGTVLPGIQAEATVEWIHDAQALEYSRFAQLVPDGGFSCQINCPGKLSPPIKLPTYCKAVKTCAKDSSLERLCSECGYWGRGRRPG